MAEKDQDYQIECNKKVLEYQGRDALLGSIFAFVVILAVLFVGVTLLMNNKDGAGYGTLIADAAMLGATFIGRPKKSKNKENNNGE